MDGKAGNEDTEEELESEDYSVNVEDCEEDEGSRKCRENRSSTDHPQEHAIPRAPFTRSKADQETGEYTKKLIRKIHKKHGRQE